MELRSSEDGQLLDTYDYPDPSQPTPFATAVDPLGSYVVGALEGGGGMMVDAVATDDDGHVYALHSLLPGVAISKFAP